MKSNFFFRPDFWVYLQQLRPPTTTESLLGCLCVICTCTILPIPGDANIHWWGPKHAQPETQNRGPTTQTNCPRLWEHPEGRGPNEWLLEPRPKVGVGTPSYFLKTSIQASKHPGLGSQRSAAEAVAFTILILRILIMLIIMMTLIII